MDAELHARRAVNGILIYCCRDDLPLQLESIAAQIAEDTLRAGQVVQVDDKVASVSRGDTSISYKRIAHKSGIFAGLYQFAATISADEDSTPSGKDVIP